MSDDLAAWLRLRETADWSARSARLAARAARPAGGAAPLEVLDLGTGAGSNVRYLAPRLGVAHQRWTVVDRSATLLTHLVARTVDWAATQSWSGHVVDGGCDLTGPGGGRWEIRTLQRDLGTIDLSLIAGRHLVTASALLDLVSDAWLEMLADACRTAGTSALFALTYDGRFTCEPAEPEDAVVRRHFNRHQHTDKGLGGPAAGPEAVTCAIARFWAAGFAVETAQTDWTIGPEQVALQRELIGGWASASTEMAPELGAAIADWMRRRLSHVDAGRSHLRVGHHDLLAVPG